MSTYFAYRLSVRSLLLVTLFALTTTIQVAGPQTIGDEEVSLKHLPDPSTYQEYSCSYSTPQEWDRGDGHGLITGRIYVPRPDCQGLEPPWGSPVVLLLHGQGYHFEQYEHLANHLARNGFVVASVDSDAFSPPMYCDFAPCIRDRAYKGVSFLKSVRDYWRWGHTLDFSRIAVVGHSQGGDAAGEAARIIRWEEPLLGDPRVKAVISLAPPNHSIDPGDPWDRVVLTGEETPAFLVLYGSRDREVVGWPDLDPPPVLLPHKTPFNLFDEAGTEESLEGYPRRREDLILKAMQFLYTADHAAFSDRCDRGNFPEICTTVVPMDCELQRRATRGFVNGFLRWRVKNRTVYQPYFDGREQRPWGIDTYPQYFDGHWGGRRVIDNFQHDGSSSTIGGNVSAFGSIEMENVDLPATDKQMLHGPWTGRKLRIRYDDSGAFNTIRWTVPSSKKNASHYGVLSFRVGLGFGPRRPLEVRARLRTRGAYSQWISSTDYAVIPAPDERGQEQWCAGTLWEEVSIAHMRTVRIPLADFGADLDAVQEIDLQFRSENEPDNWDIYLDNLEFADGDGFICRQGELSQTGDVDIEPYGVWYQSREFGRHMASLEGPTTADFDLYLQRWGGNGWYTTASSLSPSSSEWIDASRSPGYFRWRIRSWSGSGDYDVCYNEPE